MRKIIENKKASVIDILVWVVMAFVVILVFAFWVYGFDLVTTTLQGINVDSNESSININFSGAVNQTFGQVNTAQQRVVPILAYVLIFMMGLSILISNFMIKSHPAFFVIYLMIIIGAFIVAVYLSNEYQDLRDDSIISDTLITHFKVSNYIMAYLPIWTAVIGIFGAIFLFAGILRDMEAGGSVT